LRSPANWIALYKLMQPYALNMFMAVAFPGTTKPPTSSEMTFKPMLMFVIDSMIPTGIIKTTANPVAKTRS
jgi:hypothetical protein